MASTYTRQQPPEGARAASFTVAVILIAATLSAATCNGTLAVHFLPVALVPLIGLCAVTSNWRPLQFLAWASISIGVVGWAVTSDSAGWFTLAACGFVGLLVVPAPRRTRGRR